MVTIRLSRGGSKRKPFYALVVADQRRSTTGRFIERIGFYNPRAKANDESLRVDLDRVNYWISKGAQPSDRVKSLLKHNAKAAETATPAA